MMFVEVMKKMDGENIDDDECDKGEEDTQGDDEAHDDNDTAKTMTETRCCVLAVLGQVSAIEGADSKSGNGECSEARAQRPGSYE